VGLSARATRATLKTAAFAASLAPIGYEAWAISTNHVGRDPARALERITGDWTIIFLCLTLAVTPVRRLTSWYSLVQVRRMLGLFAFFYATVHFLTYLMFDRFSWLDFPNGLLSWTAILSFTSATGRDIVVRPFLAIGFAAFLVMAPLAVTSTPAMIRRLGGRRWRRLHRLVYLAAVAGLIHHWWPLGDRLRLDLYGVLVSALMTFRIFRARMSKESFRRLWRNQALVGSADPE
jgi:sulfoxide reductase heme-binding subunit YedZ